MAKKSNSMMLNPKNLGLAGGFMWGIGILICTWVSLGTGWAAEFLGTWGSLYPGYSITFVGGLIGLVYGFVDGFIGAFIIAWLYNFFQKKCP